MQNSPGRRHTYLFDLDGTLLDSIDLIFRSYRHVAEKHLAVSPPEAVWREGLGTPLRDQLRAVSVDPEQIEAMVVSYREYHHAHHDRGVRLYVGIAEVLDALAERGVKLGIVTSKLRAGAERGLKLTGIFERFDTIVTAEDVSRPKPDPAPVRAALRALGAEPARSIFIGDSPHDVAAGRKAGVETAAVLWGPFDAEAHAAEPPDFLLRTPRDILSL